MPTTLYFIRPQSGNPGIHFGTNLAAKDGTASPWRSQLLSTSRAGILQTESVTTVAGPTAGRETRTVGILHQWLSLPLAAAVTISGTITFNLWAAEQNMNDNVAINVVIERVTPTGAIGAQVIFTSRSTEVALTTSAVNNFTGSPVSTAFSKGDRIRVRVLADDAGTMGSGGEMYFNYSGTTSGANGDSYITFTENLTFEATAPTGTKLWLTDDPGPAVGSVTELEMWTTQGDSTQTGFTAVGPGWVTPVQAKDVNGINSLEWYSRQLSAFTLDGLVECVVYARQSSSISRCGLRYELAVCDADGSNPVVWSAHNTTRPDSPSGTNAAASGELFTDSVPVKGYLIAPATAVTAGKRLRFRVYIDDCSEAPVANGSAVDIYYNNTDAVAAASYILLPQTVTEYSATPSLAALGQRPMDRYLHLVRR